jgi:hypothetical protein
MGRFYSIPGMSPSQRADADGRLVLPDIYAEEHHAQLGEFLESRRNSTSHLEVGLQAGEKVTFVDAAGERRPAIVDHEERDQHSGTVSVHLHANDQTGSGSYRMDFKPDDARSLKAAKTIRTHE